MTERVEVYGFGSYFDDEAQPEDIDLLLLHRSADLMSCQLAVECKSRIMRLVPKSDVVMLSEPEAVSLRFFDRAKPVQLGSIGANSLDRETNAIVAMVRSYAACQQPAGEQ